MRAFCRSRASNPERGQDLAILTYGGRPRVCSSGSPDPERHQKKTPPHRSAGACPPPYGNRDDAGPPQQSRMGQDQAILTYGKEALASVVRDRLIPNGTKKTPPHRSAGACPPHRATNARDRPSPYGNREPLAVVRDRLIPNGLDPRPTEHQKNATNTP